MKKQSVLIQRAVLFTAIVALVAVAVGFPVYLLLDARAGTESARASVLEQARELAGMAAELLLIIWEPFCSRDIRATRSAARSSKE